MLSRFESQLVLQDIPEPGSADQVVGKELFPIAQIEDTGGGSHSPAGFPGIVHLGESSLNIKLLGRRRKRFRGFADKGTLIRIEQLQLGEPVELFLTVSRKM